MQEKIKLDGIRGIKQKLINNKEDAIKQINENLSYPLIMKPIDSAGTEGVTLCFKEVDVINSCERFLNAKNIFGIENKYMLVQE